jgi:predicted outer membrane repeat protein
MPRQRSFIGDARCDVGSIAKMLAAVLGVTVLVGVQNAYAVRLYVNASSTKSNPAGSSWAQAFHNLQDALDKASATNGGDEIWVAKGTYEPTRIYTMGGYVGGAYGRDNPSASDLANLRTFNLPDQVTILGGFQGNETRPDKRDPIKYPAVLDGGGSAYHIITAGNDVAQTGITATLDGLTITGGNATGAAGSKPIEAFRYQHNYGAGLYIAFGSNITVQNVRFTNNKTTPFRTPNAGDGAGLFANSSDVRIADSYFGHNVSGLRGGALEILNTFEGATSHRSTISRTVFESNSTGLFGGAIVGEGGLPNPNSQMNIDHSVFTGNEAIEGGAIVFDSLTTNIQDTVFQSNHAFVNGGALATTNVVDTIMYRMSGQTVTPFFTTTIVNSQFIANVADGNLTIHDTGMFGPPDVSGGDFPLGGGALVTYMNGYTDVSNSVFKDNRALSGDGGAILNGASARFSGSGPIAYDVQTTVKNTTFTGNSALTGNGGAIASLRDPRVYNSVDFRVGGQDNTRMIVGSSNFQSNSAGGNGASAYFDHSTVQFENNIFGGDTANTALNTVYGQDSIINGTLREISTKPP